MKKMIAMILAVVMLAATAAAFTSCKKQEEEKVTVIMGFDAAYPPFTYEENGKYVGFDVEFAQKVFEKLGYELKFKAIDWDAKDSALKTGDIDCIWSGFTYEGRENDYAWTARYLDNTIVVLTKKSANITSLSDLAGKNVAVQSDSSGETALKSEEKKALVASFNGGKYNLEADYTVAFTKLKAGAYDALVVDVGVANYLKKMGSAADGEFVTLSETISKETYGVGFRTSDKELCKMVSDAMESVAKDKAFIQSLCDKYDVSYEAFTLGK